MRRKEPTTAPHSIKKKFEPHDGVKAESKKAHVGWSFDVVEAASNESFPASDAPGWVFGPPN